MSAGYWKDPERTATAFGTAGPDRERYYRTGDQFQRDADGDLYFISRLDDQVKVRGHRIELQEVNQVLKAVSGGAFAYALAHPVRDGIAQGIEAFLPLALQAEGASILEACALRLPEYMVPVIFVPLEALPLSPNGKLDRKALPAPEMRLALASPRVYEPPQNETETRLAEIWQEILQVEAIGRNDDFFALGGHSLTAVRLVARMNSAPLPGMPASQAIPLRLIFEAPTLAQLALALRQSPPVAPSICSPPRRPTAAPCESESTPAAPAPRAAAQRSLWSPTVTAPATWERRISRRRRSTSAVTSIGWPTRP